MGFSGGVTLLRSIQQGRQSEYVGTLFLLQLGWMHMTSSSGSLTTVDRAFAILELLWELDGAGPSEVAERLDIPDSTAYEYLRALRQTRYVTAERGTYSLSKHVLTMGGKMRHRNQLFQVAKQEMRHVAANSTELVGLSIEDAGNAIILHQEEGARALELGTYVGATIPMHTNASGKAILAFLPSDRIDDIIGPERLERRTNETITDPDTLRAELDQIRAQGYVVDWDEQVVGMGMAAVPITVEDTVLGSVCIVAPTDRIKHPSYQEELLQSLQELSQTIAINYQYGR